MSSHAGSSALFSALLFIRRQRRATCCCSLPVRVFVWRHCWLDEDLQFVHSDRLADMKNRSVPDGELCGWLCDGLARFDLYNSLDKATRDKLDWTNNDVFRILKRRRPNA